MKVMISGYYGFHNIGDEAILKSIIIALKQENPNIEIVVLSNDIQHTKNTYGVEAINRWNLPNIYKELLKCDGLISGGGSLLQDVTSSRSILYYTSIIWIANVARKPIFIYAQGVGPINKKLNKKITKYFFDKSSYITLRDTESAELVKSIGVKKPIDLVPDPVMGFDINNYEAKLYNTLQNEKYITVSIREWNSANTKFYENIAKTCDELAKHKIKTVFVPMHGERDEQASIKIASMMDNEAEILNWNVKMEEKMMCIKHSKLMIGMRLHALIFAATVQTPMIGISYDPKIDSYLKLINQPCIGSTNDKWGYEELTKRALEIIENDNIEKQNLEKSTENLKEAAKLTAKKTIMTFSKNI